MKADLVKRTQLQIQQQQQLMREKRKMQNAMKTQVKPSANQTNVSPVNSVVQLKHSTPVTQRVLFPRPQLNPRVSPGTDKILASLQKTSPLSLQGTDDDISCKVTSSLDYDETELNVFILVLLTSCLCLQCCNSLGRSKVEFNRYISQYIFFVKLTCCFSCIRCEKGKPGYYSPTATNEDTGKDGRTQSTVKTHIQRDSETS